MLYEVSGVACPPELPYAGDINIAATSLDFWPCVLAAIGCRETIIVQESGWLVETYGPGTTAANVVSADGGHGVFQLTDSYPPNWEDPVANGIWAIQKFLQPAVTYWHGTQGQVGDALVKCIAAEFNTGRGNALKGFEAGNVDQETENQNYGATVVQYYHSLILGKDPVVN